MSRVYIIFFFLDFNLEFLSSVNDETSFRGNTSDVNEPEGVFVFPSFIQCSSANMMNLSLTAGKYGVEYVSLDLVLLVTISMSEGYLIVEKLIVI